MPIEEGSGAPEETTAERNARIQAAFDQASANMPTTTAPDVPYDVQDIQGMQQTNVRAPHLDVPYEQWKANLDVQRPWDWIDQPLRYDTRAIQNQREQQYLTQTGNKDRLGIGGEGTPAELAAGFGFGVSSYQWSESPNARQLEAGMDTKQIRLSDGTLMTVPTNATDLMKQGQTYKFGADQAAISTLNYINNFGYPSFITPYVKNKFGWSDEYIRDELGYEQDASGNWVLTDRGDPYTGGGGGSSGNTGGYRSRGYSSGPGAGYAGGSYWNLVNWRIGL